MFKSLFVSLLFISSAFAAQDTPLTESDRKTRLETCIQESAEDIVNLKLVEFCNCRADGGTEENCNKLSEDIDYKKVCMEYFMPNNTGREEEFSKYCDEVINEKGGALYNKRIAVLPPADDVNPIEAQKVKEEMKNEE